MSRFPAVFAGGMKPWEIAFKLGVVKFAFVLSCFLLGVVMGGVGGTCVILGGVLLFIVLGDPDKLLVNFIKRRSANV